MLRAIHVENFRSFEDSGRIELSDLNVFIGPNSAGKSNLMTVVELALQTMERLDFSYHRQHMPLALEHLPSFGSFDSVVRRPSSRKAARPSEFSLLLEWAKAPGKTPCWERFAFEPSPVTGAALVRRIDYGTKDPSTSPRLTLEATDPNGGNFRVLGPDGLDANSEAFFVGGIPFVDVVSKKHPSLDELVASLGVRSPVGGFLKEYSAAISDDSYRSVIVVRPHRPVPRSVYVLDDPMMAADDRAFITSLLQLWTEEEGQAARGRIAENLKTLTLADSIVVRATKRKRGPQLAEVMVAPTKKHPAVTLADVGYGVSQVLPLLSHEAQLSGGNLVVYQPEAHLHPLAQSRLADVFVSSVERNNRIYVETHSEHLVLRLQALIAGGEIAPDRVRVFCVEHDGKNSSVKTMAFDELGVPKDRWPKGFLDTGLNLARDLAEKRQSKPRKKSDV